MCAEISAAYRVQLQSGFDFSIGAGVVPFLDRLGISHLYCSPYLQAAPGSTRDYDFVDLRQINADLGWQEGQSRLEKPWKSREWARCSTLCPITWLAR